MISFMFKRNIAYLLQKKKLFLFLFSVLLCFLLLAKMYYPNRDYGFFLASLGLDNGIDGPILAFVLLLVYIGTICYLKLSLFLSELVSSPETLFLRISPSRWFFGHQLVDLILLLFLKIVIYGIVLLFFVITSLSLPSASSVLSLFFLDILISFFLQILILFCYFISTKSWILCFVIGLVFFLALSQLNMNFVYYLGKEWLVFLLGIVFTLGSYLFYRKYFVLLFEKVRR